ncbi:uncharacterized protein K452DRAFT_70680 [Aplosporella prunicola CBS 121167]|uniref:Uncharacterized protein n=1 Tax=Aplosporella prunicola CBS 121167 TaxID=1176127 RepID=A0A6A6BRR8_9PEZI|nr:uncharacterized protein K452DRAFT_70680 [Aplosporella prunicola CBS 121167]KAF2146786.1 hypothetical protein K452DRAFT_70680 [Aplosporella prunicola CBS 121167]
MSRTRHLQGRKRPTYHQKHDLPTQHRGGTDIRHSHLQRQYLRSCTGSQRSLAAAVRRGTVSSPPDSTRFSISPTQSFSSA